jgi:hypothetical protein
LFGTGLWPDGYTYLFRYGISTRSVEIYHEAGEFRVTIKAFSAAEDYKLAFDLVERLAELTGGTVRSERFGELPGAQLRSKHDGAWVRRMVEAPFRAHMLIVAIGTDVEIQGPIRPFYLGARLIAELAKTGPEATLPERLLERMRHVQYVDPKQYRPANPFRATLRDGSTVCYAVWGPGDNCLVPSVGYLVLYHNGPGCPPMIPHQCLPQLAGDRLTWLDEKQALLRAIPETEWPVLVQRARQYNVLPA